jgi:hypothetical protein
LENFDDQKEMTTFLWQFPQKNGFTTVQAMLYSQLRRVRWRFLVKTSSYISGSMYPFNPNEPSFLPD